MVCSMAGRRKVSRTSIICLTCRLGTTLNLPLPKLHKHAPISIPQKNFKKLLGTFKASIPEDITARPRSRSAKGADITKEIIQLCTKIGSAVSQSYLAQILEKLVLLHPRKESVQVLLAATFLIVSSWKDGARRKVTAPEKKKVMDAFDEQFTAKELTEWIRIVEEDLEDMKWFESFPVPNSEPRKRKAEGEAEIGAKMMKLGKNISGVGNMVFSWGGRW
jgi:hypothetical protein